MQHEVSVRELWQQVARIREREGDVEGAKRARRNAAGLPNQKARRKASGRRRSR